MLLWGYVERYTRIACHAVPEVNPKTLPKSAHIAVGTVVYGFSRRIIIQPTDVAIVGAENLPTPLIPTCPCWRLELATMHATNFRHCIAIHRVVSRRLVVTKTTRIKTATAGCAEFAGAAVVLATEFTRGGVGWGAIVGLFDGGGRAVRGREGHGHAWRLELRGDRVAVAAAIAGDVGSGDGGEGGRGHCRRGRRGGSARGGGRG